MTDSLFQQNGVSHLALGFWS